MRKNKGPTLLQGAGLQRQIKPRPDLNESTEIKHPNYLLQPYRILKKI